MRGINAGIHSAEGARGAVAAKHILAAQAGLQMLERGGNAVDAAVATAFAAGVAEPWMSGLGGIDYMVIQPADGSAPQVVDYGPIRRARRIPTCSKSWRVARPGCSHGRTSRTMRTTRVGARQSCRRPRADWSSRCSDSAASIWRRSCSRRSDSQQRVCRSRGGPRCEPPLTRRSSPATPRRRAYSCPAAFPPRPEPATTIHLASSCSRSSPARWNAWPGSAPTRSTAAKRRCIAAAMSDHAGLITLDDLAAYEAHVVPALTMDYCGWRIDTTGGPMGGTTLARILGLLAASPATFGTADAAEALPSACATAFEERRASLGDAVPEPLGTSTTHLAAVDADGMVVSCTQTLLAVFGSRVTIPGTGILLNDGMYWFDPRPAQADSVGPRKRPLSNMAPLVAVPGDWARAGLGSSGRAADRVRQRATGAGLRRWWHERRGRA